MILGDSVTDVDPGKEVPYDACLSVGFLNDRKHIEGHAEAFDVVILGNQGSLLPVTDLLDEIEPSGGVGSPASRLMRKLSRRGIGSLSGQPNGDSSTSSLASQG